VTDSLRQQAAKKQINDNVDVVDATHYEEKVASPVATSVNAYVVVRG
jgi:hypothetical protein